MTAAGGASVAAVLDALRAAVAANSGAQARFEAELLLRHVLGCSRAWLVAHRDDVLADSSCERALVLARRRGRGEPIAYILGRREFWSLDLDVTPQVLIPRPETELLVERAGVRIAQTGATRACDLGTGSGAVALAIATHCPGVHVVGCERSRRALRVAAGNVSRLAAGRVGLTAGRWLAPFGDAVFDVVAGNPPYLAADDPHLDQGDLRFEPRAALVAGADALDDIRAIAADAVRCLRPGGWLLIEHGAAQGEAVRALMRGAGLDQVDTHRDLAGLERVSEGRRTALG